MDTVTTPATLSDSIISTASFGILQAGILMSLSVVVIVGNVVTIMAVYKTPLLRTVPNIYIVSMSCADILDGIAMFYVSITLIPVLSGYFVNTKFLCMLKYSLVCTSLSASAFSLNSVAVDRYVYILHPMKYVTVVTFRKAVGVVAISWVLALAVGTMPVYVNTWAPGVACLSFHVLSIWYQVVLSVLLFGACTAVILFCYGRIILVARRQMKRIQDIRPSMQTSNSAAGPSSQLRRDWKLIKMFILVFGVFFVCWAPVTVGVFLAFGGMASDQYMGYALMLGTVNSGMNVFIYAFKNEVFRKAFKKIFCGGCCGEVCSCCACIGERSGDVTDMDNNTTLTHLGE